MAHNCNIKYKLLKSNKKLLTSKTNCLHQIQNPNIKIKLLTSKTNYSHQIPITHIKNKLLKLNGQQSENENYGQFSLGFDPTVILYHCCRREKRGGRKLPSERLMGMCRWMGSHFHDWIGYNGSCSFFILGARQFSTITFRKRTRMFVL